MAFPPPTFEYRLEVQGTKYRFDVAWPQFAVALEREGFGGRHTHFIGGFKGDMEKYNAATLIGWMVFRFTTDQVRRGEWLPWIRAALERRAK